MNRELLINEPVETLIRVLPNGDVRPTSFVWRDRTRYVNDVGRHWEEIVNGKRLHCYLIQAVDNTTYQLQARTLYASLPEQAGTDFKLALNGQPLPQHHALPLTQATRYFLSYLAPAAKPDQTGEAAYELLVYWHG